MNDVHVMKIAMAKNYPKSTIKAINRCRMFLQVLKTIAEMSNAKGTYLLPTVLNDQHTCGHDNQTPDPDPGKPGEDSCERLHHNNYASIPKWETGSTQQEEYGPRATARNQTS